MPDYSKEELSRYRLQKAKEDLETAKHDFSADHFLACINRAYYSMFHTIRALLILDGMDFKKHSAVIANFRKNYIKTGVFDLTYSSMIGDASRLRGKSDYDDFIQISQEEAKSQIDNAEAFYNTIQPFIMQKAEQRELTADQTNEEELER